jgi:phosphatidylserine/phosphatidylglycerophosphate/cardiolipin synthase-like enzyme
MVHSEKENENANSHDVRGNLSLLVTVPAELGDILPAGSIYQTMEEMIRGAQKSIIVFTYAIHPDAKSIMDEIVKRYRCKVSVTFCLDDKTSAVEDLLRMWPSREKQPTIFVPNRELWNRGSMHAKCLIIDHETALISSANLTSWATDRNLEMGILVKGEMVRQIHSILLTMQRQHLIVPWNIK